MARVLAAFAHRVTPANTFRDTTIIDNKATNNKPGALLLITDTAIPGPGGTIPGNTHTAAAAYITSANIGIPTGLRNRWSIWNVDQTPMTMNAVYNVIVVKP